MHQLDRIEYLLFNLVAQNHDHMRAALLPLLPEEQRIALAKELMDGSQKLVDQVVERCKPSWGLDFPQK